MEGAHVRQVKLFEVALEVDLSLKYQQFGLKANELRAARWDRFRAEVARPARGSRGRGG